MVLNQTIVHLGMDVTSFSWSQACLAAADQVEIIVVRFGPHVQDFVVVPRGRRKPRRSFEPDGDGRYHWPALVS